MVVDAREVRLKAHRPTQKSDRRDAFELCDGLRRGIYRAIVHVPPRPVARLRELLGRRRHVVRLETAQVNAVKRVLRGALAWATSVAVSAPRSRGRSSSPHSPGTASYATTSNRTAPSG